MKRKEDKFLRIKCDDCGNEQIVFERASSVIKCLVCEKIIAVPRGGKAEIKAEILEHL